MKDTQLKLDRCNVDKSSAVVMQYEGEDVVM